MATSYEVHYRLPVTMVRFTATWIHTRDSVLREHGRKDRLESSATELIVTGDSRKSLAARIETGWIRNVNASLALTEDQRLTSASSTSEGQAGVAATGLLGAVVFAASAASGIPAAPALASALVGKAFSLRLDEGLRAAAIQATQVDIPDRVEAAYQEEHPDEYEQLARYRLLLVDLRKDALDIADQARSPEKRADLLWELGSLRQLQRDVEANLQRLTLHFQAWRASTIKTWTEDFVEEVPFDLLPESTTGDLDRDKLSEGRLKRIWERFGLMVVPFPPAKSGSAAHHAVATGVYEREPRPVTWKLWKKGTDDAADECIRTATARVFDQNSECRFLEFRKSVWAKRTMRATFGSSGALAGLDVESTSSLAAAAQLAGNLPASATGAVEQAGKLSDAVYGLRSKSLDHAVDHAKKLLDLKQSEISTSGLTATEADYAELARLKQQVEIAENLAKLQPEALATVSLKSQTDLITAERGLEAARQQLQDETAGLGGIRAEVERLRTNGSKRRGGNGRG